MLVNFRWSMVVKPSEEGFSKKKSYKALCVVLEKDCKDLEFGKRHVHDIEELVAKFKF